MSTTVVSIEARRALIESPGITLDGFPAVICGVRNPFATVVCTDSVRRTTVQVEFTWPTVARIIARDAAFRS